MATASLSSRMECATSGYGLFWQLWPQYDVADGERRGVGLEVELIGSHASDPDHVDPACPICRRVRCVLLGIADLMLNEAIPNRNCFICDIDSHSNSIVCLPALGNRSAVSVSINLYWRNGSGPSLEAELLGNIKTFLAGYGIHQR